MFHNQIKTMEKKISYKAKGMVLGNYWGGGSGAYPTNWFFADTKEELLEKAKQSLADGSIDSGMGFESLIGAVLDITKVTVIEVDEEEFTNESFEFDSIGELTDEQHDFLIDCCLHI